MMEECNVLIETTKSAEDKTSRWFDLPIDYELFRDLLGVEADSGDYQIAKTEHRNAELLPKVSAHIMRHTACTRMAEKRIDVKVLQYIMGHAHIDVTMDVYNHVSEMSRIESEITRLESVAIS